MKYRVIVAAYNEAKYIKKFLQSMPEKHLPNVIIVDDGSDDKTAQIAEENFPQVTVLKHKVNLGKGKAMETGSLRAVKDDADILVFMDADLQHEASDVDRFLLEFIKDPEMDIVFGARTMGKQMRLIPFTGNKMITILINLFYKYYLDDTQSGYRAFRTKHFNKLRWRSPDYAVETEMIINAAKNKLKYKEITISTIYLDHYKGTNVIDGIIILLKTLMWKLWK